MELFKQTFWYILCYVLYLMLIMFFTYPVVFVAYKLGFTIEQINDNMAIVIGVALSLTIATAMIAGKVISKIKG